ncbi:TPA: hypothetical protein ACUAIW_005144 [Escherichia coli]|nr:hypothetical protein [Escherichia coli]
MCSLLLRIVSVGWCD